MDWSPLRTAAQAALAPVAWDYYAGTAGGPDDAERDARAWPAIDLVPRYLRGITTVDTTVRLGGATLSTPVLVAPTAAHGLAHPDGEIATAAAAAAAGALMIYSNSATVEVTAFGAAAPGTWWAQVYLMKDRSLTTDYLARARAAGAAAIVFTVDYGGPIGDVEFRATTNRQIAAVPGNYPGRTWAEMTAGIESCTSPADVEWVAAQAGLPVWIKGILHAGDAAAIAATGVDGIIVSNHGRRVLDAVIPTAQALGPVVRAVGGRLPVLVDGGIRTGGDVLRALALGAAAVGIGRPVLWALAAAGVPGVTGAVESLTAELRHTMATCGAATIADLTPDLLRERLG